MRVRAFTFKSRQYRRACARWGEARKGETRRKKNPKKKKNIHPRKKQKKLRTRTRERFCLATRAGTPFGGGRVEGRGTHSSWAYIARSWPSRSAADAMFFVYDATITYSTFVHETSPSLLSSKGQSRLAFFLFLQVFFLKQRKKKMPPNPAALTSY